jgi:hypothetical protein
LDHIEQAPKATLKKPEVVVHRSAHVPKAVEKLAVVVQPKTAPKTKGVAAGMEKLPQQRPDEDELLAIKT